MAKPITFTQTGCTTKIWINGKGEINSIKGHEINVFLLLLFAIKKYIYIKSSKQKQIYFNTFLTPET